MRLIVARCEVRYTGRLNAVLPEALRLLVIKGDGSVMVHADHGGYKPSNWMTAPTVIEESEEGLVVRQPKTEDRLEIQIAEVLSDVEHDMGEAAADSGSTRASTSRRCVSSAVTSSSGARASARSLAAIASDTRSVRARAWA